MTEPEIFILGDSHLATLNNGRRALIERDPSTAFKAWSIYFVDRGGVVDNLVLELKDGRTMLNPLLERHLGANMKVIDRDTGRPLMHNRPHEIILLFGYVEMHRICFHPRWAKYKILGRSSAPLKPALSVEFVRDVLLDRFSSYALLMDQLLNYGLNISLLAGPPPVWDENFINERIPAFKHFMDPESRLAIYDSINEVLKHIAANHKIAFRNFSRDFVDNRGYLREEYWEDGVHANVAYGVELLHCLDRDLRKNAAERSEVVLNPAEAHILPARGLV
jgi:hypothetical protein